MPEGRDIYRDGSLRADRSYNYVSAGTEGMWEGVGQVVSGAANIAFDPLVIAGSAGYYAGKKGLLDKVGRGRKGPPPRNDRSLPPDDPFRS